MHEGLADSIDHLLVDLRLLAEDLQGHVLSARLGQVPHDPAEPVENVCDGKHPRLHDSFLKVAGDRGERFRLLLKVVHEGRFAVLLAKLLGDGHEARVVDDELSDEVQERVELRDGNAHHLIQVRCLAAMGKGVGGRGARSERGEG